MVTLENAKKLINIEIEKAKKILEVSYGPEERKWLESTLISSGKEESAVKLFVLEGTPPKGYILADYTNGVVKAFRKIDLRTLRTYRAYKKGETIKPEKPKEKVEKSKGEELEKVEKSKGEELEEELDEEKVEKSKGEELEEVEKSKGEELEEELEEVD